MSNTDDNDPCGSLRFVTMKQASEITGYAVQSLYRKQRAGTFPRRRRLGPNKVGIPLPDLVAWCEQLPVIGPDVDPDADD